MAPRALGPGPVPPPHPACCRGDGSAVIDGAPAQCPGRRAAAGQWQRRLAARALPPRSPRAARTGPDTDRPDRPLALRRCPSPRLPCPRRAASPAAANREGAHAAACPGGGSLPRAQPARPESSTLPAAGGGADRPAQPPAAPRPSRRQREPPPPGHRPWACERGTLQLQLPSGCRLQHRLRSGRLPAPPAQVPCAREEPDPAASPAPRAHACLELCNNLHKK